METFCQEEGETRGKKNPFFQWILGFFVIFSLLFSSFPPAVSAAPLKGYEALAVAVTGSLSLKPGETKTLSVSFLNIGSNAWTNDGETFASLYTYDPKYRTSPFQDASWFKKDQPVKLQEKTVKPGETGHVSFLLHAPSTAGTYRETFALAAEDAAWIPGGQFSLSVRVGETLKTPSPSVPTAPPSTNSIPPVSSTPPTDGYAATVLLKSVKKAVVSGGEAIPFTIGIKNTGTKSWNKRTIQLPGVSMASNQTDFHHSSWLDPSHVITKQEGVITPGGLDLIPFTFAAPSKKGTYAARFVLAADGVAVPGGEIEIPVEVTSDAPEVYDPLAQTPSSESPSVPTVSLIDEPIIRVGVLIVDDETDDMIRITCANDFDVKDGEGHLVAEMKAGEEIGAFYKKERYWYNRGQGLEATNSYLRFLPRQENTICTVTNFDRRKTRNAANADNTFRNILELRYNPDKNRTWLINELPIEAYLRGLAETSTLSHLNFQKTLITAARTYALYHWERATKHANEFFHVDAYADQVYNGYGQEARTPNLSRAVTETAGTVVTYSGKTAITPYFSRSDGRTRDWSEVWYGTVEWLRSVPAPCDAGKTLWGHGVGMSASQALCMANNGKDWREILTYFYTGIDLVKRW